MKWRVFYGPKEKLKKVSLVRIQGYFGTTPHPVTVTTRIIPFLVGNPYKPSLVTVTVWGVDRRYIALFPQNGKMVTDCSFTHHDQHSPVMFCTSNPSPRQSLLGGSSEVLGSVVNWPMVIASGWKGSHNPILRGCSTDHHGPINH